jgi:hypothetical protein
MTLSSESACGLDSCEASPVVPFVFSFSSAWAFTASSCMAACLASSSAFAASCCARASSTFLRLIIFFTVFTGSVVSGFSCTSSSFGAVFLVFTGAAFLTVVFLTVASFSALAELAVLLVLVVLPVFTPDALLAVVLVLAVFAVAFLTVVF